MKTKLVLIGLGIAVLVAGAATVGGWFYLQARAEQRLDAILASLPAGITATHGSVTYAVLEDRVDVADLVLDPHLRAGRPIHIRHMTVIGHVHGTETRPSSARRVVLDDVDYDAGDALRLSIGGVALSDIAIDPELRRHQQLTTALSLESGVATDIRLTVKGLNGESFEIREACSTVSGVKNGHVAGILDTGIAADIETTPQEKLHLDLATFRTIGIDLNGWAIALAPMLYSPGQGEATEHTLWGGIEAYGLALVVSDPAAPTTLAVTGGAIAPFTMGSLPFAPASHPHPTPQEIFDFVSAFSLGGFRLGEISAKTDSRPLPVAVSLGGVAAKASPGQLDYATLDDLKITAPGMSLAIGSYRLDGFAIRFPDRFFEKLENVKAHWPGAPRLFYERYRLADLLVKYPLGEVSLKDMSGGMSGTIDKPTRSTFDMVGLDADLTLLTLLPAFRGFGYANIDVEAHSAADYDVDTGLYDFKGSIEGHDMGKLLVALRAHNVPDAAAVTPEEMHRLLMAVAVEGAEVRYDDASLVDHVLAVLAAQRHATPAAIRQAAIDQIEAFITSYADQPRASAAARELEAFLRDPHAVRVQAKPDHPVSVAEMAAHERDATPEPMLELLGITFDRP